MAERKSHIVRIKGKQKVEGGEPETLDDVWADVRRTDELPLTDLGDGQERILSIAWDDDFTGDPPEDEDRIERIIKLTDPENPPDDPDDPDIWIPVPVLDQFAVFDADQKIIISPANKRIDGDDTLREVRVKRITHADTDPAEMPDPIDAENYSRVIDTVDESQYIDHEVIESSPHFDADREHRLLYGADEDDLMNSFEDSPQDRPNPPVRLDQLQNIVNVQWGASRLVLLRALGQFHVNEEDPDTLGIWRIIDSKDGETIIDGNGTTWSDTYEVFELSSTFDILTRPENSALASTSVNVSGNYISGNLDGTFIIRKYNGDKPPLWTVNGPSADDVRGGYNYGIAATNSGAVATFNNLAGAPFISIPVYRLHRSSDGEIAWEKGLAGHVDYARYFDVAVSSIIGVRRKRT